MTEQKGPIKTLKYYMNNTLQICFEIVLKLGFFRLNIYGLKVHII